jgi:hypothetical protein
MANDVIIASVFPVRGRPTSESISKRISLTNSTILEQPSFGWKGKKAWEYGGFCIASKSSAKSCSIKAWRNGVNVVCDGAGIRIS